MTEVDREWLFLQALLTEHRCMEANYAALQRDMACGQGELAARCDDIAVLKDALAAAEAQVTQLSNDVQVRLSTRWHNCQFRLGTKLRCKTGRSHRTSGSLLRLELQLCMWLAMSESSKSSEPEQRTFLLWSWRCSHHRSFNEIGDQCPERVNLVCRRGSSRWPC